MSEETLYDLRCYVSNCFNHRESMQADSGYMMLSKLMKEEYDLDNNDVDEVVSNIEDMVSKFIMEEYMELQDTPDFDVQQHLMELYEDLSNLYNDYNNE